MPLSETPCSNNESAIPPMNILKILPIPKCTHTGDFFVSSATFSTSYEGSFMPAFSQSVVFLIPLLKVS